jgi:hypothetical protein
MTGASIAPENFETKVLHPAIRGIMRSVDDALKTKDVTDKVDLLLAAKEENDTALSSIVASKKAAASAFTHASFLSGIAALVFAASSAFLPLFVAGIVNVSVAFAAIRAGRRAAAARDSWNVITDRINRELLGLAQTQPQKASKSRRFQQVLRTTFNCVIADDGKYEELSKHCSGYASRLPSPAAGFDRTANLSLKTRPGCRSRLAPAH